MYLTILFILHVQTRNISSFTVISWLKDVNGRKNEVILVKLKRFLPPANEVWGKVICLQVCVCPQGECLLPGGASSGGVWFGGCLLLGGACSGGCLLRGVWSRGVAWWRPPHGYCCGRYASYWNTFLFLNLCLPQILLSSWYWNKN